MTVRKDPATYRGYHMSLKEVAAELGITAERVRQIEGKALRKLAGVLQQRGINPKLILPDNFDWMKS